MKKNQDRLDALEKRKEELFDLPVIEEVDDVKNASGWAKPNTFREWSQNGMTYLLPRSLN